MSENDTSLAVLEDAAAGLAALRTDFGLSVAASAQDFRQVRALASAAQEWARKRHLGLSAQNDAGAIAAEATIREGAELDRMLRDGERMGPSGAARLGGLTVKGASAADIQNERQLLPPSLATLGISEHESTEARAFHADAKAVREAIQTSKAGNSPITLGRLLRVARDAAAKRKRAATPEPKLPATCDLRFGDFQTVLADLPDQSVDVILTDPPYPGKYLPLWSDLAVFAKRVLKPTGLLVAMSGQFYLPEVMARLGEHLAYRWVIAYETAGAATVVHARHVQTMWKPVLVYGDGTRRFSDLARSEMADKEHHDWGQSETGMAALLRLVADSGQVICDPFVGGGTTAVVALAAGCSFVGAENNREAYDIATHRLKENR